MSNESLGVGFGGLVVSLAKTPDRRFVCPTTPVADGPQVTSRSFQQFAPRTILTAEDLADCRLRPCMDVPIDPIYLRHESLKAVSELAPLCCGRTRYRPVTRATMNLFVGVESRLSLPFRGH
jgi:hypothetical protein